jgi:uncharacterized radical SAM superfamily protein
LQKRVALNFHKREEFHKKKKATKFEFQVHVQRNKAIQFIKRINLYLEMRMRIGCGEPCGRERRRRRRR